MIDEKLIISELQYFENELFIFEKKHSDINGELYDNDDYNSEHYEEFIYILDSIDKCHANLSHAVELNSKSKLRIDKLKKIKNNGI